MGGYNGKRAKKSAESRNVLGNFLIYNKHEELGGSVFIVTTLQKAYRRTSGENLPAYRISNYFALPTQKNFVLIEPDEIEKIEKALVWHVTQEVDSKIAGPLCERLSLGLDEVYKTLEKQYTLCKQVVEEARLAAKEILKGEPLPSAMDSLKIIASPDTPADKKLALYVLHFGL